MPSDQIFGFERYPEFRFNEPRFPQETFFGRYLHFLDVIDPRTLLVTNNKLEECVQLLRDYQLGNNRLSTNKELWEAQKIKSAILHPDTGQKIFPPFRMSGYVPFGWITVAGMLLPNPTWGSIIFWQWINQTHNALVNYSNRNATQDQCMSTYIKAYFVAVSSACSIATGLTYLIKRSTGLDAFKRMIVQRFVPLPATSLASSLNVICMRSSELKTGIDVFDEKRNVIGTSKVAAKRAVFDTTLTRAFLPVPLLIIPPCLMPVLERYKFVTKTRVRHLMVNAIVCTLSFAFSLPISLALFPQQSKSQLEECVKKLQDYQSGDRSLSNKELWQAQKIKAAILHPDTGQKIFPPFRMSGYIGFGWIKVSGMLLPNPTWASVIFWQWVNQTHNALVNYSNRNATQDRCISTYVKAYFVAVSSAVTIATGLTYVIRKYTSTDPFRRMIVQRFVPLPATSLASSLNVICMRSSELTTGIDVFDEKNKVVGTSKVAAKQALFNTTITRVLLPIPVLFIPPCVMPLLERYKFVTKTRVRHLVVNAIVCTISFAFSLPISLALFPQKAKIETHKLEPEISSKCSQPYLIYNRGL